MLSPKRGATDRAMSGPSAARVRHRWSVRAHATRVHVTLRGPSRSPRSDTDMTQESTTPSNATTAHDPTGSQHRDDAQKSDDMRTADTANGENPDADTDEPSPRDATRRGEGVAPHW